VTDVPPLLSDALRRLVAEERAANLALACCAPMTLVTAALAAKRSICGRIEAVRAILREAADIDAATRADVAERLNESERSALALLRTHGRATRQPSTSLAGPSAIQLPRRPRPRNGRKPTCR
jgi:prophage DNA circulation protein